MKWVKERCYFLKHLRYTSEISKLGSSRYRVTDTWQHGICNTEINVNWKCLGKQSQTQSFSSTTIHHDFGGRNLRFCKMPILDNNVRHGLELHSSTGSHESLRQTYWSIVRQFVQTTRKEFHISRDWLVQLWIEDRKLENSRLKRRARAGHHFPSKKTMLQNHASFQPLFKKWFGGRSVAEERSIDVEKPFIEQQPYSESATGFLEPTSREEVSE